MIFLNSKSKIRFFSVKFIDRFISRIIIYIYKKRKIAHKKQLAKRRERRINFAKNLTAVSV